MENLGKVTDFPQLNPFPTTSSKEQMSFNFLDVVTVCSDFGAQENKIRHYFYFFPFYLPISQWLNRLRVHLQCRQLPLLPPGVLPDSGSIPGQEEPLEEVMATHSSILAWKIAWTGKPGVLLSMKAQIRHDLATEQHSNTL